MKVTARPAFLKSVIIYGLTAVLLSHCSEFSTSDTAKTGSAQASVTLKLPKGVSLKPGGQVAQTGNKRAATITAITLSVSAADMTTITRSVSLTTLDATIDVPVGTARTFTALVKTDIGGSFTGSHTTDVSGASLSVSISLAISSALISGKLSAAVSKPGGKAAISTWAGAVVKVFDSAGALVGTGTAAADGTYSVDVPDGANYFVRAQIGNMVLKAYVPGTSGATAVKVNTTSTAAVMVLAQSLGVANLGDNGVSGASAIAAANISTLYASILANPNLAVAAAALESEITANYDPNGTTPSVGTAGTAATSSINTITAAVAPGAATVSAPAAPTGVAAAAGNAQNTVSWSAASGATSYNIYYSTATGVTKATGTKITGAASPYTHTLLTNGTTYYYIVTAMNAGGESAASAEASATATAPPAAPMMKDVAPSVGDGHVGLQWWPVAAATSYNVYYSTSFPVTAGNSAKTTGITGASTTITGLANGTLYYFAVSAVNAGGESALTAIGSGTPTVPPAAPTGVTALPGNGQTTIYWNAVSGATYYYVYWSTSPGVTTANALGMRYAGASTSNTHTLLTNGTPYYYIVQAGNAAGTAVSSEVSATPAYLMGGGVQNGGLALNNAATASTVAVSTLAGTALAAGTTDGTGSAARFARPYGITTDGTNLFVADQTNNTIRKIVISSGVVTTLAGSGVAASTDGTGTAASFNNPTGIATDGTNLYVTDRTGNTVRKVVIATGVVTTVAGSGAAGALDGTGTGATFSSPNGIVTDGANLFVADQVNNAIRKIVIPTGVVTTFATGFLTPRGLTSDGTNLYVADSGNNLVKKIVISTAVVTTVAGSGAAGALDGTGTGASFKLPDGITTDGTNLFIADNNNYTVRKVVISTGVVTTIAGAALTIGSTDGTGSAARFNFPTGITTDGSNLFVADGSNKTVRKINLLMGGAIQGKPLASGGVVTTYAGAAGVAGSTDATGTAARFNFPYGLTTDGTNLYVADTSNHTIRKVVIATGVVTTIAGTALTPGSTDGTGTAARFSAPYGLTTDGTNLYVADTGNSTIRQVVIATGAVTTIAGTALTPGTTDGTGTAARFNNPYVLTTDGTNLYVADTLNQTIRKVVIATGAVTTIAGTALTPGSTDGTGTAAQFNYPYRLTTDGTNLYVADTVNSTIRKIVIATGVVTTLAGSAGLAGSTDATGTAARFFNPIGLTTDGTNLYVVDTSNHTIRKIQ